MSASSTKSLFKGCYIATLTPFTDSNAVDYDTIGRHVEWLLENGTDGLCPAGTTGEFLFLTDAEKLGVIEATIKAAAGKAPVVAGVWSLTLSGAAELARGAEAAGAQGVFLPPPIYYPASDDAIYAWYAGIKAATPLPVFAYNIPQYAANTVSFACLDRLFADGVIAGAKDSTGKTERVSELVTRYGADNTVFAASDGFASEGRRLGADGFISAIGNAAPSLFSRLWGGDDSLQPGVDSLRTSLKSMGSIPALKHLLTLRGFPFGKSRIPCSDLTEEQMAVLSGLVDSLDM